VFRAHDPARDRLVAIKVFRLDVTPERARAFWRELELLVSRKISHPSIAAPIATGFEGTAPYLAMEYAVGDSLDVTARGGGPMALGDAVRIVESVAAAIDLCAGLGVHHQLLHPRDIVVSADGARVTGFGIAHALSEIGMRLPVRRPYAAPDGASDVYSLAAIAYELISGRRMTNGGWDELSAEDGPDLRDAFAAALSEVAAARPTLAGEFAARLRRVANISAGESTESRELLAPEEPESVARPMPEAEPELDTPALDRFADAEPVSDLPLNFVESTTDLMAVPVILDDAAVVPVETPLAMAVVAPVVAPVVINNEPPGPVVRASRGAQPPRLFQVEEPSPESGRRLMLVVLFVIVGVALGLLAGYVVKSRRVTTKPSVASTTVDLPAGLAMTPAPTPAPVPVPPEPSLPAPTPSRPASGVPPGPPVRAARTASRRGRVEIRSTPASAIVSVNGQSRGRTPLTVRDLALGSYNIRVARDGFAAVDRDVRLTDTQPSALLVVALKETPEKPATPGTAAAGTSAGGVGEMAVESRPAGARVFVNDRPVGSTPLVIPGLPAGPATVRIEMDGYETWATTVKVSAGEQTRVGASLDRK
jgi:eukaryotic-like serine/threonine-protein kinase